MDHATTRGGFILRTAIAGLIDGRQYVLVGVGDTLYAFVLH
jgi:hypothetical protein